MAGAQCITSHRMTVHSLLHCGTGNTEGHTRVKLTNDIDGFWSLSTFSFITVETFV